MNPYSAADAYRQASIENAPPLKVVKMLYETAIRCLGQALKEDPRDPASAFLDLVHKVDTIVSELRLALVHEHAPEIAANLERLYLFVERALFQAGTDRDAAPLADARQVLVTLLDGWKRVDASEVEAA